MTITTTQREAALRLIDELSRPHCDLGQQEAAALLRELLAEPRGEPVAWRSKTRINNDFDSNWCLTSTEPPQTPRTIAIEPLYIHPPQQRKPLTKVQITELAEQCGYDGAVPTVRLAFQGFKLDDFARAIERAHDIGETP